MEWAESVVTWQVCSVGGLLWVVRSGVLLVQGCWGAVCPVEWVPGTEGLVMLGLMGLMCGLSCPVEMLVIAVWRLARVVETLPWRGSVLRVDLVWGFWCRE